MANISINSALNTTKWY